jgi:hypothetical protein
MARFEPKSVHELHDAFFRLRLLISLTLGVLFAATGLTGFLGVLAYLVATLIVPHVVIERVRGVDVLEFGNGRFAFIKDGFATAFALFVLVWTLGHSLAN